MKEDTAREVFDSIYEAIISNGFADIGSQFIGTDDNFYKKKASVVDSNTALQDLYRMSRNGESKRALRLLIKGTQTYFRQTKELNTKVKSTFSKTVGFDPSFLDVEIGNENGVFEQKISIESVLVKNDLTALDDLLNFILEKGVYNDNFDNDNEFLNDLNKKIDEL